MLGAGAFVDGSISAAGIFVDNGNMSSVGTFVTHNRNRCTNRFKYSSTLDMNIFISTPLTNSQVSKPYAP